MLRMPSFFLFLLIPTISLATSDQFGQTCSLSNNRLQTGTYQFTGDCDSLTYCASNGTCAYKGCRHDIFPFGYSTDDALPPLCSNDQFCPDEQDACMDKLAPDSTCQLNRDDECAPPDAWRDLRDEKYGTNVNGSVCLNYQCYWANATLGSSCVIENTPYIVYGEGDQESIDIVSRGNCKVGLYCDSQQLVCISQKDVGGSCDGDKECKSHNCLSSSVCGEDADAAVRVGAWVFVLVGIGIVGGMSGTLVALFLLHQRQREQAREKRMTYWREQNAFRQNILHMQDTARASIFTLPGNAGGFNEGFNNEGTENGNDRGKDWRGGRGGKDGYAALGSPPTSPGFDSLRVESSGSTAYSAYGSSSDLGYEPSTSGSTSTSPSTGMFAVSHLSPNSNSYANTRGSALRHSMVYEEDGEGDSREMEGASDEGSGSGSGSGSMGGMRSVEDEGQGLTRRRGHPF